MTYDDFWSLTWHDFGLWCMRIKELDTRRLHDHELHLGIARSIMTMYANTHLKKGEAPYNPSDFYILSTDVEDDVPVRVKEDNDVWASRMKDRFKARGR